MLHVTSLNQSEFNIVEYGSYTALKFVFHIGSLYERLGL